MRRTLLTLAIAASIAVSGCSALPGAGGGLPNVKGGLCEQHVAAAAQANDDAARQAALDLAIKTCSSLEQWAEAVVAYGGGTVTPDAGTYLGARCSEPTSGVGGYMLCGLLAQSLITPRPDPTHKSKKKPKKTAKPKPSPLQALVLSSPPPAISTVAPVPPVEQR